MRKFESSYEAMESDAQLEDNTPHATPFREGEIDALSLPSFSWIAGGTSKKRPGRPRRIPKLEEFMK